MSLFKAREWWSTGGGGGAGAGEVGAGCVAGAHAEGGECVVVGEARSLRVYRPHGEYRPEHLLVEEQLDDYILQIDTGKFISVAEGLQVIVLHPLKLSVYMLQRKEGHTDVGDQNVLAPIITHTLNNKAYLFVHGNFGNTRNRELVCVQSLEGKFYFFDQEVAVFTCSLPDIVIPGPLGYIKSCDSFVVHSSNWILEIYSYQQLIDLGNLVQRTNKRTLPQWIYNAGEEIYSLQVIQTSNNFSSIVALGERHLYCLQDNGLMKYMKKFDFMPVCFHAYLIGWYYEPTCRLLVMVASEDSKLLIYENTTLLWSCELFFTPIAILRCSLKGLPGGIVALSEEGTLSCCYLGTEPDLSGSLPILPSHGDADPRTVQAELDETEATLKKLTENEDIKENIPIEDIIQVSIVVKDCVHQSSDDNSANNLHLLVCPIVVNITFKEPSSINNVQVSYSCSPSFVCSEAVKSIDEVNAYETVETQIFLSREIDISDFYVKILVMITDNTGKILIESHDAPLPLALLYVPSIMETEFKHKVTIDTDMPGVDLVDLFPEYTKEEWIKHEATSSTITLSSRSTNSSVSISSVGQSYTVLCDHYSHATAVVQYLILKLKKLHNKNARRILVNWNGKFNLEMLQSFMKSIESHASARMKWHLNEEELTILQSQFTLIQKKLLVQYGALPPGDCDALEFLLKDTYQRISQTVQLIIKWREAAFRACGALLSVGRLMIMAFELMNADMKKIDLLKEAICMYDFYEDHQNWEETASQSTSYVLSTMFGKSEKDKEKLAPITEHGILNPVNLKRFMKQIKILFERMFSDLKEQQSGDDLGRPTSHSQPKRVEELVEVL